MQIWKLVAALSGLAVLGFGLYLAWMLGAIRRRAFGEGRRLELAEMGVALRIPAWWRVEVSGKPEMEPSTGAVTRRSPASPARAGPRVRLLTGHRRGVLTIEAIGETVEGAEAGPSSSLSRRDADPVSLLKSLIRTKGFVLDSVEIAKGGALQRRGSALVPSPDSLSKAGSAQDAPSGALGRAEGRDVLDESGVRGAPPGRTGLSWVSVSSAGIEASEPEIRTYFELHLASVGSRRVLLTYTNSVLQGFLDAFYIERVLQTLEPAPPEGPAPR